MTSEQEEEWSAPHLSTSTNGTGQFAFTSEKANRGSNWNDPEMQALLILLKEEADTYPADFHNAYRKGPIYRRISERMKAIGFNRRADQIQCKTKKWKSLYVNVLRQRQKGKRVTCRYFKDLVEIFGDTPEKLGVAVAADETDDTVEVELSHRAAVAANRERETSSPIARDQDLATSLLQQPSTNNDTAQKLVQRSLALQSISQRSGRFGLTFSSHDISEQPVYPSPEKADLVHFMVESDKPSEDAWQSFLLKKGMVKLQLLQEEFCFSRIKMQIGNHWVRLTEDNQGNIPLTFSPNSNYVIKGIRMPGVVSEITTNRQALTNHIDSEELLTS